MSDEENKKEDGGDDLISTLLVRVKRHFLEVLKQEASVLRRSRRDSHGTDDGISPIIDEERGSSPSEEILSIESQLQDIDEAFAKAGRIKFLCPKDRLKPVAARVETVWGTLKLLRSLLNNFDPETSYDDWWYRTLLVSLKILRHMASAVNGRWAISALKGHQLLDVVFHAALQLGYGWTRGDSDIVPVLLQIMELTTATDILFPSSHSYPSGSVPIDLCLAEVRGAATGALQHCDRLISKEEGASAELVGTRADSWKVNLPPISAIETLRKWKRDELVGYEEACSRVAGNVVLWWISIAYLEYQELRRARLAEKGVVQSHPSAVEAHEKRLVDNQLRAMRTAALRAPEENPFVPLFDETFVEKDVVGAFEVLRRSLSQSSINWRIKEQLFLLVNEVLRCVPRSRSRSLSTPEANQSLSMRRTIRGLPAHKTALIIAMERQRFSVAFFLKETALLVDLSCLLQIHMKIATTLEGAGTMIREGDQLFFDTVKDRSTALEQALDAVAQLIVLKDGPSIKLTGTSLPRSLLGVIKAVVQYRLESVGAVLELDEGLFTSVKKKSDHSDEEKHEPSSRDSKERRSSHALYDQTFGTCLSTLNVLHCICRHFPYGVNTLRRAMREGEGGKLLLQLCLVFPGSSTIASRVLELFALLYQDELRDASVKSMHTAIFRHHQTEGQSETYGQHDEWEPKELWDPEASSASSYDSLREDEVRMAQAKITETMEVSRADDEDNENEVTRTVLNVKEEDAREAIGVGDDSLKLLAKVLCTCVMHLRNKAPILHVMHLIYAILRHRGTMDLQLNTVAEEVADFQVSSSDGDRVLCHSLVHCLESISLQASDSMIEVAREIIVLLDAELQDYHELAPDVVSSGLLYLLADLVSNDEKQSILGPEVLDFLRSLLLCGPEDTRSQAAEWIVEAGLHSWSARFALSGIHDDRMRDEGIAIAVEILSRSNHLMQKHRLATQFVAEGIVEVAVACILQYSYMWMQDGNGRRLKRKKNSKREAKARAMMRDPASYGNTQTTDASSISTISTTQLGKKADPLLHSFLLLASLAGCETAAKHYSIPTDNSGSLTLALLSQKEVLAAPLVYFLCTRSSAADAYGNSCAILASFLLHPRMENAGKLSTTSTLTKAFSPAVLSHLIDSTQMVLMKAVEVTKVGRDSTTEVGAEEKDDNGRDDDVTLWMGERWKSLRMREEGVENAELEFYLCPTRAPGWWHASLPLLSLIRLVVVAYPHTEVLDDERALRCLLSFFALVFEGELSSKCVSLIAATLHDLLFEGDKQGRPRLRAGAAPRLRMFAALEGPSTVLSAVHALCARALPTMATSPRSSRSTEDDVAAAASLLSLLESLYLVSSGKHAFVLRIFNKSWSAIEELRKKLSEHGFLARLVSLVEPLQPSQTAPTAQGGTVGASVPVIPSDRNLACPSHRVVEAIVRQRVGELLLLSAKDPAALETLRSLSRELNALRDSVLVRGSERGEDTAWRKLYVKLETQKREASP